MRLTRSLTPLLALVLVVPGAPALGQADDSSRTFGDVVADALEDLAREIGSAQDEIGDLAPGVDPSDPDGDIDPGSPGEGEDVDPGDIDPGSPGEGEDVDPGDIDPTDPGAMPGEADVPTEPGEPGGADEPDGIEVPEPSEPEEGGFAEIFLAPDPAPREGRWRVRNKAGTVTCTRIGSLPLRASTQTGRITLRNDGKKLTGRSMFQDQSEPVNMTWDPESNRYRGRIRLGVPGGQVNMKFTLRVVSPRKMAGRLSARVTVDRGGVSGRCIIDRGLTLTRIGG